jgi:multicomponent Na+:H+ antiporter subunit E
MKVLVFWIFAAALWMLLFWSANPAVIAGGCLAGLVVSLAMRPLLPENLGRLLDVRRWFWAALFVPYFLYYVVRANLDIMLRVLNPDLPIRPGIVKLRTNLQSPMARMFLANSISLTPGTLTIDLDGQDLYVHWINISTDEPDRRGELIVGKFEPLLRRIFE